MICTGSSCSISVELRNEDDCEPERSDALSVDPLLDSEGRGSDLVPAIDALLMAPPSLAKNAGSAPSRNGTLAGACRCCCRTCGGIAVQLTAPSCDGGGGPTRYRMIRTKKL